MGPGSDLDEQRDQQPDEQRDGEAPAGVRRYDLQVHTRVSPCSRAQPRDIVASARRRGLDGLAITDHDTMAGYDAVCEYATDDLELLAGCEVTTTQGHLLALGIEATPPRADPLAAIDAIHREGGVAVLSHPFDRLRERYETDLAAIADAADGVEVRNSRCVLGRDNRRARTFAAEHDLAPVGGSDAHFPIEIGRAYTVCERPILEAIRAGETDAGGRGGYLSGHAATKIHDVSPEWVSAKLHDAAPNWL